MKPGQEPSTDVMFIRNKQWVCVDYGQDWVHLGIAPRPKTQWQAFIHHIAHGVLMNYPVWDVLVWSWKNRDSFEEKD